jgi:hypothetical protein
LTPTRYRRAKQNPQNYAWLAQLLARRLFKVVAIALANKMARVAWALLARGGTPIEPHDSRQRFVRTRPPNRSAIWRTPSKHKA